jgi:hypothetical protein
MQGLAGGKANAINVENRATKPLTAVQMERGLTKIKPVKAKKDLTENATTVKRLVIVLVTASKRRESKVVNRQTLLRTRTQEKEEEVADVVLTTIDAEEASYMMCKPCNVNYFVYTDRKGNECLTCLGCETYDVKGWRGKELCSVPVDGGNDENIHSLDDSDSSVPLLLKRKDNEISQSSDDSDSDFSIPALLKREDDWSDNSDDDAYQDDTQGQDMALVTNDSSSELLDYLHQVAVRKGIREPNVDSWANSVETKLNEIQMRTPKDVVSNIIALNQLLQNHDLSMIHNKTLHVMARVGVEYLCSFRERDDAALTLFELPNESDHVDDGYGDAGFFDQWSSSPDEWSEDQEGHDDETDGTNTECCFMLQGDNYRMNKNTWLGDSAASTHMGFSEKE